MSNRKIVPADDVASRADKREGEKGKNGSD